MAKIIVEVRRGGEGRVCPRHIGEPITPRVQEYVFKQRIKINNDAIGMGASNSPNVLIPLLYVRADVQSGTRVATPIMKLTEQEFSVVRGHSIVNQPLDLKTILRFWECCRLYVIVSKVDNRSVGDAFESVIFYPRIALAVECLRTAGAGDGRPAYRQVDKW